MRMLSLPTLLTLLIPIFAQPVAAADMSREEYYLSRNEIAPTVLREAIGAVSVWRGLAAGRLPDGPWMLATFEHKGHAFTTGPRVAVKQTRPVSGWDFLGKALRQYPVVQRSGLFVLAVLDSRSDQRAWLRVEKAPRTIDYLHYAAVGDPEAYTGQAIDLFHFSSGARRIYVQPRLDAPFRIVSKEPGGQGFLAEDLKVVKVQGNFAQVAKVMGVDQLSKPLGWVEIRDREGRLTIWYVFAPGC